MAGNRDVLQDPKYLTTVAYATASKLQARVSFWRKYGGDPLKAFGGGLCERFRPSATARILEVGCGTGEFWSILDGRFEAGWSITLSDLSSAMVREARTNLAALQTLRTKPEFVVADVQNMPFESGTFDTVVANHMLYHLPDISQGIGEIARVLAVDGTIYATTFGGNHLREVRDLQRRFAIGTLSVADSMGHTASFSLENGERILRRSFRQVSVHRQNDAVMVDSAADLLVYMESLAVEIDAEALRDYLESTVRRDGSIALTRSTGYLIAHGSK